jgi:hypothetical protein
MLQKRFVLFFGFFFLVFLQLNYCILAQASGQNVETRPFTDLSLKISVPGRSPLLLQPIPIVLKLSNPTNQPIMGPSSIGFGECRIYLTVQKVGSDKRDILPLSSYLRLVKFNDALISARTDYQAKEWLAVELNKYFPDAGMYELQAGLANADGSQQIQSNKIYLQIESPTGVDREVFQLIKNSKSPNYFFDGLDYEKVKDVLDDITTRYPNSAYTQAANFMLGKANFYRKDYQKALKHLQKLENDSNFIHNEKVKKHLDEIREILTNSTP